MIERTEQFVNALSNVGGKVKAIDSLDVAVAYIVEHLRGSLLLPASAVLERAGLPQALKQAGVTVIDQEFRSRGASAMGGLTGANFGIAATGTVVLESTREEIRIASTLPETHFVVLDPGKIFPDAGAVIPLMRRFHVELPQAFLAYVTGPSRTADIERVLTIGVHGPRELHVLLWPGLSADPMEA